MPAEHVASHIDIFTLMPHNRHDIMQWDKLISDKRFGLEHYHDPKPGARNDFQRDFDRLVFSSPFRRLQR